MLSLIFMYNRPIIPLHEGVFCMEKLKPVIKKEFLPSRELEFSTIGSITLSSGPGGGTTTAGEKLINIFGSDYLTVKNIGILRRDAERERTGKEIEEVNKDNPLTEFLTDQITKKYLREATPEHPYLFDAQLGGFIATRTEDQMKKNHKSMAPVAKFLLTCNERVAAERVRQREAKKGRNFTTEQWLRFNRKRHQDDLRNWRRAYPELNGVDPLNGNQMEKGKDIPVWKRFYDYKIDTTFATPDEIVGQIIISLLERGYIRKKDTAASHSFAK